MNHRLLLSVLVAGLFACADPVDGSTTTDTSPVDTDTDTDPVDTDPTVPCVATVEVCDGLDNDCDGDVDEDAEDAATFFADADGDGFGDALAAVDACGAPEGFVDNDGDCDDSRADVNPDEIDLCDGVDHDCDATTGLATLFTEEGAVDLTPAFQGTAEAPSAVIVDQPGDLHVCEGQYFVHLDLRADVDIVGLAGSAATVLDGGGAGSLVAMETPGVTASLVGLTLQNGAADATRTCRAGGICVTGGTVLTGDDLVLQDHVSTVGSGALHVVRGSALLSNVHLLRNAGTSGGAIAASENGRVEITTGEISFNVSSGNGGAVATNGGETRAIFEDVRMEGNVARVDGGAIHSSNSRAVTLRNAHVVGNTAGRDSGALEITGSSSRGLIEDSIIEGNTAVRGGAILMTRNVTLRDSDLFGNTATDPESAAVVVQGGTLTVERCNFEDPITGEDNAPLDLLAGVGRSLGLDVTDTCTATGCSAD